MTPEQSAAFINAQTSMLLVELELMKAANRYRAHNNMSDAYSEADFQKLYDRYEFVLGYNAVLNTYQEAARYG